VTDDAELGEVETKSTEPLIKPAEYRLEELFKERESGNWRNNILRIT